MSPDPYLGSMDAGNPQSLNRYAYVLNNPLSFYDPRGLEHCESQDGKRLDQVENNQQCDAAGGKWIGGDVEPTTTVDVGSIPPNWSDLPNDANNTGPGSQSQTAGSGGSSFSWWGTFTTDFFKLSGGPGNVPTCAGQTLRSIADELSGGLLKSQAVDTSLKAGNAYQSARAWNYAATRANTLGGTGLICPSCSSTFRSMMSKAGALGKASEVLPLIEVSVAAGNSIPDVMSQARSGTCAAAFPIF